MKTDILPDFAYESCLGNAIPSSDFSYFLTYFRAPFFAHLFDTGFGSFGGWLQQAGPAIIDGYPYEP